MAKTRKPWDITPDEIAAVVKTYERCSDIGYFLSKDYKKNIMAKWRQYCCSLLMDQDITTDEVDSAFVARVKTMQKHGEKLFGAIAQVGEELVRLWEAPKLSHSVEYVVPAGLLFRKPGRQECPSADPFYITVSRSC